MSDVTTAPAPSPSPAPNPAPNPGTTPAPAWFEGKADAETIGHWDNKGWKKDDPINIAIEATKQARELQKHFGVPADQLIKLPKADDEAGWRNVHQRLGTPAEAKDYDFSGVKWKDGTEIEATFADAMRNALHSAFVPKDKASTVVKTVIDYLDGAEASEAAERAARLTTQRADLQKDWGANWEFNRLQAMQGARRLGLSEEGVTALEGQVGYKNVMEALRKIGAGTTEDTFVSIGPDGHPTTRMGAQARLAELQSDTGWAQRLLAGEPTARREFDNLMLMIHGEAA